LNLLAKPGIHEYIVVLDHLKATFNIGKIFRSAQAFGAREVHLIGTDFFDPAPGKGAFKWVPAAFYSDFNSCYEELIQRGYVVFVLDPSNGAALPSVKLPKHSAFIFGHEEFGLSFRKERYPDLETLMIPQSGAVQSLNVSIAASIVMYEYIKQHPANKRDTHER
jgi:tRNA G18 (ribose-2'-O)-methylase SpoU